MVCNTCSFPPPLPHERVFFMKLSLRKNRRRQGAVIRWGIQRDMIAVLEIERMSFKHPMTEKQILEVFEEPTTIIVVAERNKKIVGYAIYDCQRESLFITSIAVHPHFRRQHIGRKLMVRILRKHAYRKKIMIEGQGLTPNARAFFAACDRRHGVHQKAITID